jgi:hypothetical protein
MRIREDNRNMILLAAVALFCAVVAGALALLQGASQLRQERLAADMPAHAADPAQVRVIGTPFVPNVNPRER